MAAAPSARVHGHETTEILVGGAALVGAYMLTRPKSPSPSPGTGGSGGTITPGQVTGLTISQITQTSALASWNAASNATSYQVSLNGQATQTTTGTTMQLTGLSPGTTYTVSVVPCN